MKKPADQAGFSNRAATGAFNARAGASSASGRRAVARPQLVRFDRARVTTDVRFFAPAIDAGTAETKGSVHESAVAAVSGEAPYHLGEFTPTLFAKTTCDIITTI